MLLYFNINQFNLISKRNNVILSNIHVFVTNDLNPSLSTDKHHSIINMSLNHDHYNTSPIYHGICYDFKKCDYVKIKKYIVDVLVNLDLAFLI
jgi:hypothetical protein